MVKTLRRICAICIIVGVALLLWKQVRIVDAQQGTACTDTNSQLLRIGDRATGLDGSNPQLFEAPGKGTGKDIESNREFLVLGGPQCDDKGTIWRYVDAGDNSGWLAVGINGHSQVVPTEIKNDGTKCALPATAGLDLGVVAQITGKVALYTGTPYQLYDDNRPQTDGLRIVDPKIQELILKDKAVVVLSPAVCFRGNYLRYAFVYGPQAASLAQNNVPGIFWISESSNDQYLLKPIAPFVPPVFPRATLEKEVSAPILNSRFQISFGLGGGGGGPACVDPPQYASRGGSCIYFPPFVKDGMKVEVQRPDGTIALDTKVDMGQVQVPDSYVDQPGIWKVHVTENDQAIYEIAYALLPKEPLYTSCDDYMPDVNVQNLKPNEAIQLVLYELSDANKVDTTQPNENSLNATEKLRWKARAGDKGNSTYYVGFLSSYVGTIVLNNSIPDRVDSLRALDGTAFPQICPTPATFEEAQQHPILAGKLVTGDAEQVVNYAYKGKAGETLTVELSAFTDTKRVFDPKVAINTADGKSLAENGDLGSGGTEGDSLR